MGINNAEFIVEIKNRGVLDEETLSRLMKTQKLDAYQVLRYVIAEGLMLRPEAVKLWADCLNMACIDIGASLFQSDVVAKLPKEFARKNAIIFIYKLGDAITAAMSDPWNAQTIREAQRHCGEKISSVFAMKEEIEDAIEVQYNTSDGLKELIGKLDFFRILPADLNAMAGNEGVAELARSLLLLGVKEKASDIHLEPYEKHTRLRLRIDGILAERVKMAKEVHLSLISNLKVQSGLDITERRKPQDGRLALKLAERTFDFRLSTAPTIYGEKMVLRLLGEVVASRVPDMEDMEFSRKTYGQIKRLVKSPNGIIFITGPTGSGKTTTLFSALKSINTSDINIMTAEDPVEYRLPGINQVQVNREIDLTFAGILRTAMRQDPNVLLIGEIRDLETAKIATEAALTGHLVLSTLHTNDALQAVTRLVEIGVEPFVVGSAVIGVMAQRLVRILCAVCKEPYLSGAGELGRYFSNYEKAPPVTVHRAKGCKECGFSGYKGRIGIHEILVVNDVVRELVAKNRPMAEIKNAAFEAGYEDMRYDGLKKVLRGLTTFEEVDRVTVSAELSPV